MFWPMMWWIFPLACIAMMAVMFVFMAGMGGMRCMRWLRRGDGPRSSGGDRQSFDEASSSSSSGQSGLSDAPSGRARH